MLPMGAYLKIGGLWRWLWVVLSWLSCVLVSVLGIIIALLIFFGAMSGMSGMRPALLVVSILLAIGLVGSLLLKQQGSKAEARVTLSEETPLCAPREDNPQRTILPVGATVVDFELRNMEGRPVRLSEELAKKPVVLEMFATWCPHCQESAPVAKALHEQYGDSVSFLAINAGDRPGEASTSGAFKKEHGLTYPILEAPSETMMSAYCLESFPLFYVIDQTGKVRFNHAGSLKDKPEVEKAFKAAMESFKEQPQVPAPKSATAN